MYWKIRSSDESEFEELVADIPNEVQSFINSEDIRKTIKDDQYKITITSKDDKDVVILKNLLEG
ncbi:hypothetical protein ACSVDA_14165 [Cytobacillus sp. Hm23]|uniref:hypothetical protein n=1 Tax=Cytobacillus sp. IB215665 TaxID=3097357 RepID=UPI002A16775A|nr:hypothetical protein [Cytobacillus sp. IB215665]MDX8365284.1 hypothetical protein [Cytobacillus sp. IB215665]